MKEIKFRYWDTYKNKMSEPYDLGSLMAGEPYDEHIIVMQYTGLKDKNGVEIYEGDLISGEQYDHAVVKYSEEEGCFLGDAYSFFECVEDEGEFVVEINGNIYENPKLLREY